MVESSAFIQIVLAAGRSERMGCPKALLAWGGRSFLRCVLDAAAGSGIGSSIVVLGAQGEEVRAAHDPATLPLSVQWVTNTASRSEQLDSLKTGLRAVVESATRGFFIHPVDCPLATDTDYQLLLDAFEEAQSVGEYVVVLSHGRRRGHPVLCHTKLIREFLVLPAGATARQVMAEHAVRYVETPNSGVLEDVDTPGDLERLRREFGE